MVKAHSKTEVPIEKVLWSTANEFFKNVDLRDCMFVLVGIQNPGSPFLHQEKTSGNLSLKAQSFSKV